MATNENIKVVIKARPLIKREREQKLQPLWRIQGETIECISPLYNNKYSFDQICDVDSSTQDLYDKMAQPIVQSSVNGFNGTIFAYGQTSSGKTHTMLGNADEPGVMVLAVRQIFSDINTKKDRLFLVKVTYIEIYNEKIYDLLNKRHELKIQESGPGGLNIGCAERMVTTEKEIMDLVSEGTNFRKVAETNMNVQSSRSHTIFSIVIESEENGSGADGAVQASTLNLVDLAGSERADATAGKTENRFREGAHINKSLLSLNMVISKLGENQDQHINYRDSKLTRILQPSLGGNSMTAIICTITLAAIEETSFTLGFATRAKQVKNKPVVNEVVSEAVALKRMKKQIGALEDQLADKERKLTALKGGLFHYGRLPEKKPDQANRRRTWAFSSLDVPPSERIDLERPPKLNESDEERGDELGSPLPKSIFGHNIEYTDEEFQEFLDVSLDAPMAATRLPLPSSDFIRSKLVRTKPSMLKTPKSMRHKLVGLDKSVQEARSTCNTPLDSPIGIDKSKQAQALVEELEELRHFQQTENQIHQTEMVEFENLKTAHAQLHADLEQLKARHEAKETEFHAANAQRDLANQQYVCIEFEFGEQKKRFQRREQELIAQIAESNSADETAALKDKIKVLTEKGTALESQLWQSEKLSRTEIDELEAKLTGAMARCNQLDAMQEERDRLQREYNEMSDQLMDYINEIDQLKSTAQSIGAADAAKEQYEQSIEAERAKRRQYEEAVVVLKQQVADYHGECMEMESHCHGLEHRNTMLEHACDQSRLAADLLMKELDVLRSSFRQLETVVAQQELDHLKFQKTVCEESGNFSCLLNATEAINSTAAIDSAEALHAINALSSESLAELSAALVGATDETMVEGAAVAAETMNETVNMTMTEDMEWTPETPKRCAQCGRHQQRIQAIEMALAQAESRVQALTAENATLAETIRQAEARLEETVRDQRQANERELAEKRAQIEQLVAERQALEQQIVELNEKHQREVSQLAREDSLQSRDAEEQMSTLRRDYEAANERVSELLTEQQASLKLRSEREESEKCRRAELNERIDELTADVEASKLQVAEANAKIAKLEADIKQITALRDIALCRMEANANDLITVDILAKAAEVRNRELEQLYQTQTDNLTNWRQQSTDDAQQMRGTIARLEEELRASQRRVSELAAEKQKQQRLHDAEKEAHIEQSKAAEVELAMVKECLDKVRAERAELEARLAAMQAQELADDAEQSQKLREQIADLLRQKDEWHNERTDLQQQSHTAGRSLDEALNAKIQLQADKAELELQLNAEQLNLKQMLQTEIGLRAEMAAIEKQRKSAQEAWQLEANAFAGKIAMFEDEQKCLETDNAALKQSLKEQIAENERLARQTYDLTVAEAKLNELNARLHELGAERAALSTKIDELSGELDVAAEERRKSAEQLHALAEANDGLSSDNKRLAEEQQTTMLKLQKCARETLDREVGALQRTIAALKEDQYCKEMDNAELKQLLKEKIAENERLDQATLELAAARTKLIELNAQLHTLSEEKAKLQETIEERTGQLNVAVEEQRKSAEQLHALREDNDRLSTENEVLASELEIALDQQQKSAEDALQREVDAFQHKIAVLEDEQMCLETENATLKQSLGEKVAENARLEQVRHDLADAKAKLNELRSQLHTLGEENVKLRTENEELSDELKAAAEKRDRRSLDTSTASASTPKRRSADFESIVRENTHLKSVQKSLETEVQDLRRTSQSTRRMRRQSTHDSRRISGFSSDIDVGTQTDPATESCHCAELAAKIEKLERDIIIKDAQYKTLKKYSGVDELKAALTTEQAKYTRIEGEHTSLAAKHRHLVEAHAQVQLQLEVAQAKPTAVARSSQTEAVQNNLSLCTSVDLQRSHERAEKYKAAYVENDKQLRTLQREHDRLVEEQGKLAAKLAAAHELSGHLKLAADELQVVTAKKEQMKRVAESRLERIKALTQANEELRAAVEAHANELMAAKRLHEQSHAQPSVNVEQAGQVADQLNLAKVKYEELKATVDQQKAELQQCIEGARRKDAEMVELQERMQAAEVQYQTALKKKEGYKMLSERLHADNKALRGAAAGRNNENVPINN